MNIHRGDVVLARVPHTAGTRGKKRPAVVVQSDVYNAVLRHAVVAEVTSNPRWANDPACLYIDITTSEGRVTGLHKSGYVTCIHLVTMSEDRLKNVIGKLSKDMLDQLNNCLITALAIP